MLADNDVQAVRRLNEAYRAITDELGKVIVGQQPRHRRTADRDVCRRALLAGGRAGPGQDADDPHAGRCAVARVQPHSVHARPDAVATSPARKSSRKTSRPARASSSSCQGPIFANVILADEINRTPPKTQAALLGSDAGAPGHRRRHSGTGCPSRSSCWPRRTRSSRKARIRCRKRSSTGSCSTSSSIIPARTRSFRSSSGRRPTCRCKFRTTLSAEEILALAQIVRRVPVADHVTRYALQFTRLTRREKGDVPDFVRDYVSWGAGPRASQYLVLGAKARAVLHGRYLRDDAKTSARWRCRCCGIAS